MAIVATRTVLDAGGVGVIFVQSPRKDVSQFSNFPFVRVHFTIGTSILTYIETASNHVVKFNPTRTTVGQQISPEVALFSAKGPSSISPSVLKPDVAAPGVNILVSWSPVSSPLQQDPSADPRLPSHFNFESATSMACPHITVIVALLKSIHPNWSPAAIKYALVTTVSLKDKYGQSIVAEGAPYKQADPFDYGGGHVVQTKHYLLVLYMTWGPQTMSISFAQWATTTLP